jgi:hypothetical protein
MPSRRAPRASRSAPGPARAVLIVAFAGLCWAAVVLLLAWVTGDAAERVNGYQPARPEDAVTLLAGVAGLLLAGWLALGTLLTLLAAARPGSWPGAVAAAVARRITPAGLRRAVVLAVGVGLVGGGPAFAADVRAGGVAGSVSAAVAGPDPARAAPVGAGDLDPGWVPTPTPSELTAAPRTPAPHTPAPVRALATASSPQSGPAATPAVHAEQVTLPDPGAQARRQAEEAVVVRSGDCLWDIAARRFGPHATAEQIAAEWPRWYQVNRAVIGDQPDLLEPGQRLRPPGDTTSPEGAGRGGQP